MKATLSILAFGLAAASVVWPAAMAESIDAGQAYAARCIKCHGESGTGTFMLARRLGKDKSLLAQRPDLQPDFIRHVVRNGIVSMPALTRVEVTDAELDAIVRYLTRSSPSTASSTHSP